MADEMVRLAQRFVNTTYNNGATLGISKLDEDGRIGWPVMYALTRGAQATAAPAGARSSPGSPSRPATAA
ncbi:hypothetical protein [Kitasatospora sp. NPDC093558]|uniref:hypothetical protein n=1 Tax=Kitasatospora sp. NPDC093558 TaxID=3155201 RepID=UPI003435AB58